MTDPAHTAGSATPERVRQAELARIIGCSRQNVSKMVKAGKLEVGEDGKLDVRASLEALEQNTDPTHQERLRHDRVGTALANLDAADDDQVDELDDEDLRDEPPTAAAPLIPPDEGKPSDRYNVARAEREKHQAELTRLKLEREAGRLVDADQVKRESYAAARGVRDAILAVPERLGPLLAVETDERRVRQLLTEELEKALAALSRSGARFQAESHADRPAQH